MFLIFRWERFFPNSVIIQQKMGCYSPTQAGILKRVAGKFKEGDANGNALQNHIFKMVVKIQRGW